MFPLKMVVVTLVTLAVLERYSEARGWGMNDQDDVGRSGWGLNDQDDSKWTGWGQNDQDDDTQDESQDDDQEDFKGWGQNEMDDQDDFDDERTARASNAVWNVAVAEHNKYRKMHGAGPLTGDPKIHAVAQRYADKLAPKGNLVHSKNSPYGENLAISLGKTKTEAVKNAVKQWYDEVKDYKSSNPVFHHKTGHFTAVVWKGSKKLGIGVSKIGSGKYKGNWMVVANYSPAGNTQGKFRENVQTKG